MKKGRKRRLWHAIIDALVMAREGGGYDDK